MLEAEFLAFFKGKYSEGFNPTIDLQKIGVVNQTTMLASETQEITEFLRQTMITKYGESTIKNHIADTRDTLCYATNDNQSATLGLLEEEADLAIVVGGYNSSNTTHLVELLEEKFKTFFILSEKSISAKNQITSFNIHSKQEEQLTAFLPEKEKIHIILTSGASCPDAVVDAVIVRILELNRISPDFDAITLK
jgi:4-hydroxy-3-methylbut-2-enyl diphosphate reductase